MLSTEVVLVEQSNTVLSQTAQILMLQVNGQSRRAYASDALIFKRWLEEQGIFDIHDIDYDAVIAYHAHLLDNYATSTAARRFTVMRRLLDVAVDRGMLEKSPVGRFKAKIPSDDSSPHTALTKNEARRLLSVIDTIHPKGKRDYAMLMLLIFGGLRRAECAAIKLKDIVLKEEHHVLVVQSGKGRKRRDIPLRPDVFRSIQAYLETTDRLNDSPDSLLFTGFFKGSKPSHNSLTDRQICNIVKAYALKAGVTATPHDLRATFITLALDTGANIVQVQRLAGHSDPKITERYYTRKQDIDNSPVYKIDLNN